MMCSCYVWQTEILDFFYAFDPFFYAKKHRIELFDSKMLLHYILKSSIANEETPQLSLFSLYTKSVRSHTTERRRDISMFKSFILKTWIASRLHAASNEFMHFIGTTKMHGCCRLCSDKSYAKLFWLIVMTVSAFIFVLVVVNITEQYLHSNVITKMDIVYDYPELPFVTICSYNNIRRSRLNELKQMHGFSDDLLNYLLHTFAPIEAFVQTVSKKEMDYGQILLDEYKKRHPGFSIYKFVMLSSDNCEELFVECSYAGKSVDCCDPKYTSPVMTDLGRCYEINLRALSQQVSSQYSFGSTEGLKMVLDFHADDQIGYGNTNGSKIRKPFSSIFEPGFRIYTNGECDVPFLQSGIIALSPDRKISVALKPIKNNFVKKSAGGICSDHWPEKYRHAKTSYSQTACQAICIASFFMELCGCSPFEFDIFGDLPACEPKRFYDCMNARNTANDSGLGLQPLMPSCVHCLPQCNRWSYFHQNIYTVDFTSSEFQYLQNFNKNFVPSYVRSNIAMAHVFFEARQYLIYSQLQASHWTTLLSNIAGNSGLFLGATLLTLFEVGVFLFKTIWIFLWPNRTEYMAEKIIAEDLRRYRIEELIRETSLRQQEKMYQQNNERKTSQVLEAPDSKIVIFAQAWKSAEDLTKPRAEPTHKPSNESLRKASNCTMRFEITPIQAKTILDAHHPSNETIWLSMKGNKLVVPLTEKCGRRRSISVI
ncbi:hypothetical protein AB6A40_000885 [Gnathostoma spinigerum]|uniref:Uncharacterized protein n=1 Tax=Gnathostoma spinigerum TaxID=75299 RepID=A0ABD6E540_9BILA